MYNVNDEYITCLLCGTYSAHQLNGHLSTEHNTDSFEYRKQFPGARIHSIATEQRIIVAGERRRTRLIELEANA